MSNLLNIRQDRYADDSKQLVLHLGKNTFKILDYSLFGLGVEGSLSNQNNLEGSVTFDGVEVINCKMEIVRVDEVRNVFGVKFLSSYLDVNKISILRKLKDNIDNINHQIKINKTIHQSFKLIVHELSSQLSTYRLKLRQFEGSIDLSSMNERKVFEDTVIEKFAPQIYKLLSNANKNLGQIILDNNLEKSIAEYVRFYRNILGDYLYSSPFAERSFQKPLGYAGDYEMMSQIYRNDNFAKDLFGRCIEKVMQMHPEPQAVRNRINFLSEKILRATEDKDIIKVLSVACGPALEICKFLELNKDNLNGKNIEFYLLDQDEMALKRAQFNILSVVNKYSINCRVSLVHKDIKTLVMSGLEINDFDLIYSAGLFDYFSNGIARRTSKLLKELLKGCGKLIIGNFDSETPHYFGMIAVFDWELILRSKSDMKKLYTFNNEVPILTSESSGINLFVEIMK